MPAALETDVGITEYIGDHAGFTASFKVLFRDFIVNEVDATGTVLHLTSTELPPADRCAETLDERGTPRGASANGTDHPMEEALAAVRSELVAVFEEAQVDALLAFVRRSLSAPPDPSTSETTFRLSAAADKPGRTRQHEKLRLLGAHFASRTVDGGRVEVYRTTLDGNAWIDPTRRDDARAAQCPRSSRKRGRPAHARDTREQIRRRGGAYLSFLLCKQNADTSDVVLRLARHLHLSASALTHAGTKDRRAVTTQEMRVSAVSARQVQQAGMRAFPERDDHRSQCIRVRVGNFRYVREPLHLGDLYGNRFTVVLRHVPPASRAAAEQAVASVQQRGFVNYYGLQRFGSRAHATHEIGVALLRGEFRRALDMILETDAGQEAEAEAEEGQLQQQEGATCECLPPSVSRIVRAYFQHRDAARALREMDALPRRQRHRALIERRLLQAEAKYGAHDVQAVFHALPRNLRMIYFHAVQSAVWNCMASARLAGGGSDGVRVGDWVIPPGVSGSATATDVDGAGAAEDERDHRAAGSKTGFAHGTPVHRVTDEDVAAEKHSIFDVVLPVPGTETPPIPCPYAHAAYQAFVQAHGVELMGAAASRIAATYHLRGTYRYVLARPERLQSEWMERRAYRASLTTTDLDGGAETSTPTEELDSTEASTMCLSLKLEFTLRPAEYATMLLRELTRSASDRDTQAALAASRHPMQVA